MAEHVILVDENDNEIGTEEKIQAHKSALLHRAFSVFVFNKKGELLLQKRAAGKYHSAGLWTNTCCSHPRQGEDTEVAAHRRLQEEMGFDCPVEHRGHVVYKAPFSNGLTEHEFDHLFVGHYDGDVTPNPDEVEEFLWVHPEDFRKDVEAHPSKYTAWVKVIFEKSLLSELR